MKRKQPDKLDLGVKGFAFPPNVNFDVDAEWRKKQRFRKIKRT